MPLPLPALKRRLSAALAALRPADRRRLPEAIDVIFLGKRAMGKVHAEFLDDPSPTDVITFDYGEILVCPEVAAEQGPMHGRSVEDETLLYGIHGLLHLAGYDDHAPADFRRMAREQDRVCNAVLAADE